jgi:hypothetical protein
MSAQPSASTCSATSGVLMRLEVTSGVVMPAAANSAFILRVTQAKAARGTLVAMVGTRASCQPMPVLMMLAPPRPPPCPAVTTSSQAAAGHQVDHRQAVDDDEVRPHRLAHARHDLHRQAHAVL